MCIKLLSFRVCYFKIRMSFLNLMLVTALKAVDIQMEKGVCVSVAMSISGIYWKLLDKVQHHIIMCLFCRQKFFYCWNSIWDYCIFVCCKQGRQIIEKYHALWIMLNKNQYLFFFLFCVIFRHLVNVLVVVEFCHAE